MRKHAKLVMVALIAVIATAFSVGTAAANTITATPAGGITATSLNKLTFSGRGGIEIEIECNVTLRGSVERTIGNARGGRVGTVTEGVASACNGSNTARPLFTSPTSWTQELNEATRLGAEGRATSLATINIVGAQFQVVVAGTTCLYTGTVPTSLLGRYEGERLGNPVITQLILVLTNSERRSSGSFLCPERGELRGSFRVTTQTLRL